MVRIAVFASGSGTNFENIVNHINESKIPNVACAILIVDKEDAYARVRAKKLNIPCQLINYKDYANKELYEIEVLNILKKEKVELIVLAGYMRIISPVLLNEYKRRIINLHPAYLPDFPGKQSILDAFVAKVPYTGVSVHYIDEGIDTGEIIDQVKVEINSNWDLETLEKHIHEVEYQLFPSVIKKVCEQIERECEK